MRGLYNHFLGFYADTAQMLGKHPTIAFAFIILGYIIAVVSLQDYIFSLFPRTTAREIVVLTLYFLFGIWGILIVRTRELPVFIIPITGYPAVIMGVIIVLVNFGIIISVLIKSIGFWSGTF
jgi:hypothetical protein